MNKQLIAVITALYNQFGDQGIAWAQEQVATYMAADPNADFDEDEPVDTDTPPLEEPGPDTSGTQDSVEASTDKSAAAQPIFTSDQVVDTVLGLVLMAGEVRKFEEAEVTARLDIAAQRDVALAQVKAHQQLLQDYLDRSFDERSENFKHLFEVVDEALRTDNVQALALGLESVVKLAVSSPFKDLGSVEETATALADPTHEWDF